jgi:predicted integral membrane protein DUF2269
MRAMPDLSWTHAYIKYVHVLGVFLFLIGHGVSVMVLLGMRRERDPGTLRTLLSFSTRSMGLMGVGAAIWLFSGIYLGFSGNYWTTGSYWIWASLAIAIVTIGVMTPMGRLYLNRVRIALGQDPTGKTSPPIPAEVDAVALEAAVKSGRPMALAVIGFGALAVLAWLMMFHPF